MRELIKLAALGAGAYLIAKEIGVFGGTQAREAEPPPAGVPSNGAAAEQPTDSAGQQPQDHTAGPTDQTTDESYAETGEAPAGPLVIVELMKQSAPKQLLSFDHWNWVYRQLTGKPGPAPETIGIDRAELSDTMTAEQWAALVTSGGFTL